MTLIIGYIAMIFGLIGVIAASLYTFLEIFVVIKSKTPEIQQSIFVRLACGFLITLFFMMFWGYIWTEMMQ